MKIELNSTKKTFFICLLIGLLFLNGFMLVSALAKGKPPDTKPPRKVTGLAVTVVPEGNTLQLDWDKSRAKDLDHYNIYRSTTPGFVPDLENPDATSPSHHYTDIGLTDGVPYYYRVAAVDTSNNIGEPSDEASGTPSDTVAPEQVVGVEVTNVPGGSQLELTWTASTASDLDHYNVYRSTTAGFIPGPANLVASPATNTYLDTGLTDGVRYYYRIAALDEVPNEGPASDEASGVPGDVTPPSITIVSVLPDPSNGVTTITVTNASSDIDANGILANVSTPGGGWLYPAMSYMGGNTWTGTFTVTADGVYAVRINATDFTSNTGYAGPTSITGDVTPPSITIVSVLPNPSSGPTTITATNVSSDIDANGILANVSTPGGGWLYPGMTYQGFNTWMGTFMVTQEGTYTVRINATDYAWNTGYDGPYSIVGAP